MKRSAASDGPPGAPSSISVGELRERLAGSAPPIVLDVRREPAFVEQPELVPGAERRLPEEVEAWADELPQGCEVIAYCVLGHQVSQNVVARLEQRGIRAKFLEGGIERWRSEGGGLARASPDLAGEAALAEDPGDATRVER